MSVHISQPGTSANAMPKGPSTIRIEDSLEKTQYYFFKNNPWKLSPYNRYAKIFRYCIVCGQDRFGDTAWNKREPLTMKFGDKQTICDQQFCVSTAMWLDDFAHQTLCKFHGPYTAELRTTEHNDTVLDTLSPPPDMVKYASVFGNWHRYQ